MKFYVESLCARTSTTARASAWRQWARTGVLTPDETPPACDVPALLRRRLTPLGRLALGALADLEPRKNEPMIFASSWGDVSRSFTLMQTLVQDNEISPTHFSASVHNGIGAIASIWQGNTTAYKAICAQDFTTESAFLEAWLMLCSGHASVLLVRYEEPMPEAWYHDGLTDTTQDAYAWAVRLTRSETALSSTRFKLTVGPSCPLPTSNMYRDNLDPLSFLLSDASELWHVGPDQSWLWRK